MSARQEIEALARRYGWEAKMLDQRETPTLHLKYVPVLGPWVRLWVYFNPDGTIGEVHVISTGQQRVKGIRRTVKAIEAYMKEAPL